MVIIEFLLIGLFRGNACVCTPQHKEQGAKPLHQRQRARADGGDVTLSRQAVRSSDSRTFLCSACGISHGSLGAAARARGTMSALSRLLVGQALRPVLHREEAFSLAWILSENVWGGGGAGI